MNYYVYVSAALTGLPTKRFEWVCRVARTVCVSLEAVGVPTYFPGDHSAPGSHHTPAEVYELDKFKIRNSSGIVVLGDIPAFGVGMELAWADQYGKPVVITAMQDPVLGESTVSRIVLGVPGATIVRYASLRDLTEQLRSLAPLFR